MSGIFMTKFMIYRLEILMIFCLNYRTVNKSEIVDFVIFMIDMLRYFPEKDLISHITQMEGRMECIGWEKNLSKAFFA